MPIRQLTVEELARMRAAGEPLLLVDVRQPWENETAALPDSLLIPLNELDDRCSEVSAAARARAGALVVAYCHHGVRSLSAAAILASHDVQPVASLAGGIDAWSLRIDPSVRRY
ncbi:MAG TPA: rhodanese-like domain-containing protein [Polyangia bacterium]|jgi:adenylyltransferase/sulfurtransferase|nr:rhodanese-like domain-containing protein [Polyangia bacterium]